MDPESTFNKIDVAYKRDNLRYNYLIELQRNKIMGNKGPFTNLKKSIFNRPRNLCLDPEDKSNID